MFHHVKKLMYTVRVDSPDPRFGNMLLEQFGGANGELAAAMQYYVQGLNADDPARKDMLIDIGVEELSHLEIIGTLAKMHLKPLKDDFKEAQADPLTAVAGGGGVNLFNSQGNPWTADYLKVTGELDVDLRSNIAAEARAKIVYERLINFCDDNGYEGRPAVPDDPRDHPHEGVHRGPGEPGQGPVLGRQAPAVEGRGEQVLQRLDRRGRTRARTPAARGTRAATGSTRMRRRSPHSRMGRSNPNGPGLYRVAGGPGPGSVTGRRDAALNGGYVMGLLKWSLIFLIVAGIAALFGFGGIAEGATDIAKVLFFIFLAVCLVLFAIGVATYKAVT